VLKVKVLSENKAVVTDPEMDVVQLVEKRVIPAYPELVHGDKSPTTVELAGVISLKYKCIHGLDALTMPTIY
jgi:hypothetical protein